jgi:hypothetical protein
MQRRPHLRTTFALAFRRPITSLPNHPRVRWRDRKHATEALVNFLSLWQIRHNLTSHWNAQRVGVNT